MIEEEEDEENRDWWTKYFSSLEAVAAVSQCIIVVSLYFADKHQEQVRGKCACVYLLSFFSPSHILASLYIFISRVATARGAQCQRPSGRWRGRRGPAGRGAATGRTGTEGDSRGKEEAHHLQGHIYGS